MSAGDAAAAAAVDHVRTLARRQRDELAHLPPHDLVELAGRAPLTVNLHPDRLARTGRTVVEELHQNGVLRNQFETGISAGGLDHVLGGSRKRWETAMFAGAYDGTGTTDADRPRYAGLDLAAYPTGACPRFGSCVLVLTDYVRERATYTWGDSVTSPTVVGVHDVLEPLVAAMLRDGAPEARGEQRSSHRLDDYVEAQVHGPVSLQDDVRMLVVDPSFRGTTVGDQLERLCGAYGIEPAWHHGYVLPADGLDPMFRTETSPRLAVEVHARLARPGQRLDAELVGRAAQAVVRGDGDWSAFGADRVEVLQELKYLWHHLVAHGRPT